MTERMRHDVAAASAAFILGASILFEGARLVLDEPWRGFEPEASSTVSALLIVLWSATLAALLLRRRLRWSAAAAWFATFVCPIAMVAHAGATRAGGEAWGLLYLPAALALAVSLKRCFDHGELSALPGAPRRS